ncbi:sugar phosphate isomerase/epimerase [Rubellicoccus peritrichatus]|uniref:Sugar phosphate isomerase/epimerase n=1 Tax=Rubellicoccus peritrichatus TaxID=3080537 RepID=A0AAQ3L8U6_9BACT|nr:sugar phosphate isomerase/epimerase [Puniceicoccus sp. CR14]WOO41226.1 sugar phosphate isomerase/epimerase [Puniceicoccus sp. CR14]
MSLSERSELNWCFSSMGCPEYSLPQIASLAENQGISYVELRAVDGRLDIPAYAREKAWINQDAETLITGNQTKVIAFNASAKLSMPFDEAFVEIEAFAPLMKQFNSEYLRIFDGNLNGSDGMEKAWSWMDAWENVRAERDWNFDLTIETHDSLLTPETIEKLFSKGHENVHLLWDSHHTWKKAGQDPVETWQAVRQWTNHIHIKDSISKPSARHPYTYVLPGEGEFPLLPLISKLEEDKFAGPVSLEWEKLWHPYMPSLEEALVTLRNLIAPSLEYSN